MEIQISNLQQIEQAARIFVSLMPGHHIFAFYGNMGAGKTTFIKELCRLLGVTDNVTSPTFAIVNEYALSQPGKCIYHFDFYRIKQIGEVYDIGYEDYFYSGNTCFLEWPELVEELLPPDVVRVHIKVNPDDSRCLTLEM